MDNGTAGSLGRRLVYGTVTEAEAPAYIPSATLESLVENLTVEDVRLARADYPEGDPMRGFASVYYAARRLGETGGADDASAFLARVRLRDLTPILERAAQTLPEGQAAGPNSPGSVGSGG